MIGKKLSVKKMFFGLTAGMTLTMTAIILVAFFLTKNIVVLWVGMALIVCAILWMLFMVQPLGMRLSNFTSELCQILDDMMNPSQEPENVSDKETIFARIHHRLVRLYNILQESNRKVVRRTAGITVVGVRYFPSGQNSGKQHEDDCGYTFDKTSGRTGEK